MDRSGRSTWIRCSPALARGTNFSLAQPPLRDSTGRLRRRWNASSTPPIWASISSTSPRFTPSAERTAKAQTTPVQAGPKDPGSPWAIGAEEGGHRAIHPELGTLDDFKAFLKQGRGPRPRSRYRHRLSVRAGSSRWVKEHPEWFRHLPDGSIAYAENPPKRYEDILPFDFECEDWEGLWQELLETTLFWVDQGVRIFRVDNPHTKPLPFWEWMIARVRAEHPEVIFLAEAFTRPDLLHGLAKRGFTQSYTYFAWRNTRDEVRGIFHRVGPEARRANISARTSGQTHRTSCPSTSRRSGRPGVHRPFRPRRDTLGQLWHLRSGLRTMRQPSRRGPAAKSTWTPRSTRSRMGPRRSEWSLREFIARVNRDPAREPGAPTQRALRVPCRRQTTE